MLQEYSTASFTTPMNIVVPTELSLLDNIVLSLLDIHILFGIIICLLDNRIIKIHNNQGHNVSNSSSFTAMTYGQISILRK